MADRYAYLSFVGLFIMVCWGVAEWARQRHISSASLAAVSVAVLVALAVTTRRQISYWDDNVKLWSHAVAVTRNNYMAEDHLGGALLADGQMEAAMPHFYRAVAINPRRSRQQSQHRWLRAATTEFSASHRNRTTK